MMHLFINGLGASAGGGLTYLANVLPHLSKARVRTTVAVTPEFEAAESTHPHVEYVRLPGSRGAARRYWSEQKDLPQLIQTCGADVLISAGNFALRRPPVPQILLSGNSLYTCADFFRALLARGEYRMWIENRIRAVLAARSVVWADMTVAPSVAFAHDLEKWTGRQIVALHHGFDYEFFTASRENLPASISNKLAVPQNTLRILLVSHYNYYRNFETVFRAVASLKEQPSAPEIRLFLTCELERCKTPGAYDPRPARQLIERLGIRRQVIELGAVPYQQLHHVYRACHILVTAAYAETFAHPLVEAMSCGLPIVASDLAVHREVCGEAALYFSCFSPESLGHHLLHLAQTPSLRQLLGSAGRERSQAFSWKSHVEKLLRLAEQLRGADTRNVVTMDAA